MQLLIYCFTGLLAVFGIMSIKDVKLFDKVKIKSVYILSVMAIINVPLMLISMIVIKEMSLTLLMVTMVICEALRIGAFYTERKFKKQFNSLDEKAQNNRAGILKLVDSDSTDEDLFFKKTNKKRRAI